MRHRCCREQKSRAVSRAGARYQSLKVASVALGNANLRADTYHCGGTIRLRTGRQTLPRNALASSAGSRDVARVKPGLRPHRECATYALAYEIWDRAKARRWRWRYGWCRRSSRRRRRSRSRAGYWRWGCRWGKLICTDVPYDSARMAVEIVRERDLPLGHVNYRCAKNKMKIFVRGVYDR